MLALDQDVVLKAFQGLTDVKQVQRACRTAKPSVSSPIYRQVSVTRFAK